MKSSLNDIQPTGRCKRVRAFHLRYRAIPEGTCGTRRWFQKILLLCSAVMVTLGVFSPTRAAEEAPPPLVTSAGLAERQREIAALFEKFQALLLRLAELGDLTQPQQLAAVEKAIRQAESRQISVRMNRAAELLATGRLASAAEEQERLLEDLRALVELLLAEDQQRWLQEERRQWEAWLRRVEEITRRQRDLRARTTRPEFSEPKLAGEQEGLAGQTDQLHRAVGGKSAADSSSGQQETRGAEGPSGPSSSGSQQASPGGSAAGGQSAPGGDPSADSSPESSASHEGAEVLPHDEPLPPDLNAPEDSTQQARSIRRQRAAAALRAAQQRMRQAAKRLHQAQREEASAEQEQALVELEKAKAELQRILRQLRQEEMARVLRSLEARIQRMLSLQREVYQATENLAGIPEERRGREEPLQIARLARQEAVIGWEADQMLLLLQEDATAAAMIEATTQLRGDIRLVEELFAAQDVGPLNLSTQQAILASLQEMLEAVRERLEEIEKTLGQGNQMLPGGQAPLVDLLAELRMLRALQQRIRTRTEEYQSWLATGTQTKDQIEQALRALAERQARLQEITRQLSTKLEP